MGGGGYVVGREWRDKRDGSDVLCHLGQVHGLGEPLRYWTWSRMLQFCGSEKL